MTRTFVFKDKSVGIDLSTLFNENWREVLKPLFETEYFAALLNYIFYHYVERNDEYLVPDTPVKLFAPFQYSEPEDIKVVLMYHNPFLNKLSSGIGFGGGRATNNPRIAEHNIGFTKIFQSEKSFMKIDDSLEEWLDQGVLVLNRMPMTTIHGRVDHLGVFDYFYECIIRYLHHYNEDLVVATTSTSTNRFILDMDGVDIETVYSYEAFPIGGGLSLYGKINNKLIVNGNKPIRWARATANIHTT